MGRPKAGAGSATNRRDALVRAAARLFVEKGFAATTTRDIAEAVGMRAGSPFYHFRSKQALLEAAILDGLAAGDRRQRTAIAGVEDPETRLRALVRTHLATLLEGECRSPLLVNEARALDARARTAIAAAFDRYQAPWQQTLAALADAGRLASAAPPVRLLLFGMLNWSSHWYRNDGVLSVPQLADAAVALLLGTSAPGSVSGSAPGSAPFDREPAGKQNPP